MIALCSSQVIHVGNSLARRAFMIASINNGCTIRLDAETQGEGWMIEVLRRDLSITYFENTLYEIMVADVRRKSVQRNREVLVLHLA